MGVSGAGGHAASNLTPRQRKWFASVQASLERDTGKTLEAWVVIAKSCPETRPRARAEWLREHYGLGANRAAHVLSVAFPTTDGWDHPEAAREALWTDPASRAIFEAVEKIAMALPDAITGQRKAFTAFSREFQFAAVKPIEGGKAMLGLAVTPDADPRACRTEERGLVRASEIQAVTGGREPGGRFRGRLVERGLGAVVSYASRYAGKAVSSLP